MALGIFSTSSLSPPDVPLRLVVFEDTPHPPSEARINLGQSLTDVFVYRALADLKHTRSLPHR